MRTWNETRQNKNKQKIEASTQHNDTVKKTLYDFVREQSNKQNIQIHQRPPPLLHWKCWGRGRGEVTEVCLHTCVRTQREREQHSLVNTTLNKTSNHRYQDNSFAWRKSTPVTINHSPCQKLRKREWRPSSTHELLKRFSCVAVL